VIPTFNIKEIRSALDISTRSQTASPVALTVSTMVRDLGDIKSRFNVFRWSASRHAFGTVQEKAQLYSRKLSEHSVKFMWVPRLNYGAHRGMVDISSQEVHQVLGVPGDPLNLMNRYWNMKWFQGMQVNHFGQKYEELVLNRCAYLPKPFQWQYDIVQHRPSNLTGLSCLYWTEDSSYPQGWYPSQIGPHWADSQSGAMSFYTEASIGIRAPLFTPCNSAVTVGNGLPI